MRIVKVEPGRAPYEKEIENNLKSIQAEVGVGLFQPLYLGAGIVLCCNEEGKLRNLPWNRALRDEAGQIYDIVAGTCFLCAAPPGEDSFAGLTDAQLDAFSRRFAALEWFIPTPEGLVVLREAAL